MPAGQRHRTEGAPPARLKVDLRARRSCPSSPGSEMMSGTNWTPTRSASPDGVPKRARLAWAFAAARGRGALDGCAARALDRRPEDVLPVGSRESVRRTIGPPVGRQMRLEVGSGPPTGHRCTRMRPTGGSARTGSASSRCDVPSSGPPPRWAPVIESVGQDQDHVRELLRSWATPWPLLTSSAGGQRQPARAAGASCWWPTNDQAGDQPAPVRIAFLEHRPRPGDRGTSTVMGRWIADRGAIYGSARQALLSAVPDVKQAVHPGPPGRARATARSTRRRAAAPLHHGPGYLRQMSRRC